MLRVLLVLVFLVAKYQLTSWQKLQYDIATLKNQRTTYHSQWTDIADTLLPYRLRLNLSDQNRGDRRNTRIYDSTATFAVDTLESGLMSAASNPATRWVTFTTKDPDRAEFGPHKRWLDYANTVVLSLMNGSNLYRSLPTLYGNAAGFGTSLMSIEEVMNGETFFTRIPAMGSWWIGQNWLNSVDTVYREFRMTIRQMYERFGDKAEYSVHVQQLMDSSKWQEWLDVGHMVSPATPEDKDAKGKRYKSCWFELGSSGQQNAYRLDEGKYLHRGGFDVFPYVCARWELTEGDVYAIDCPGMKSISDNKGLQAYERRAALGVEKIVNPHWLANEGLTTVDPGFIPGGISYVQERDGRPSLRPAHEINPGFLGPVTQKEEEIRSRIHTAFKTDTFQALRFLDDKVRTATEIIERKAEGLNDLVKTYTGVQRDVLKPIVDWVFMAAVRQGLIGPAPEGLQGHELEYEYNGVLAQAQRMSKVQPIDRMLQTVGQIAATGNPGAWDKLNTDQAIDVLGSELGVDATIIRSDEETAALREQRAKAQQAQDLMQNIPGLAKGAKDLSETKLDDDNALGALVKR